MSTALANPTVVVNNVTIAVVPNSVKYTEGLGEQNMRAASSGGGSVEQVFSRNIENNFSMVSFSVFNSPANIATARVWKTNENQNVISISGTVTDNGVSSTFSRSFTNAAILNNYEVNLGADTEIELEFQSDAAA